MSQFWTDFLIRVSSRKFLTALAVQIVAVIAIFAPEQPEQENELLDAAMRIVGLVVLLLAAIGYGRIEGAIDAANKPAADQDAAGQADGDGGG